MPILSRRRRGAAAGWIIVIIILAALAALVAWRMIEQRPVDPGSAPATQPDRP